MKTLQVAFGHTLQDVHCAETALTKALPKVARAAASPELKDAVEMYLDETRMQVKLLDKAFKAIGKQSKGEKCAVTDGLIKEAEGIMEEAEGQALDAALIGAAQAVEHNEIARYGTLREWAKQLGEDEAHETRSQILDQGKAANAKLTPIAVTMVNPNGRKRAA